MGARFGLSSKVSRLAVLGLTLAYMVGVGANWKAHATPGTCMGMMPDIDASDKKTGVIIDQSGVLVAPHGGTAGFVIVGSRFDDKIIGSQFDDVICAGNGFDEVQGGPGDDVIAGERGDDVLHGGAGDDTVLGGSGDDTIEGNEGADQLYGNDGRDVLYGNDDGTTGDPKVDGGDGHDVCNIGPNDEPDNCP
jgi:Ca2+-binding RTX toxin-like protein